MTKNIYYTYAWLRDDKTPYYIGKGCGGRAFDCRRKFCPPRDRILILKKGLSETEAFRHEIYMIAVFGRKDLGLGILHNRTDGGDGSSNRVLLESSRRKMVEAATGRKHTEKTKQKISKSKMGEKNPNYGRSPSQETKEKLSIANSGERNHQYGKPHSDETKKKMSEALTGRNHTEETKKKLSDFRTGKTLSEETKRKMSEAQQRRRQREMMDGPTKRP